MKQKVKPGAKPESKPVERTPGKGIRVISRPAQFRRAGYTFTSEPTTIDLAELTDEQLEALRNERNLVVTEVDIAAETNAQT